MADFSQSEVPSTGFRCFRLFPGPNVTAEHFTSQLAKGRVKVIPTDPDKLRRLKGISVQDTIEGARTLQNRFPKLGDFIAELVIPEDAPLLLEEDGPGHYNILDPQRNEPDPSVIAGYVIDTYPVRQHPPE